MPNAINIPGKKVWQGSYLAFVPAPLPPELKWTPRLIGALSDADRLVGRLAGQGGRLPNPHILIRPFVQREAAEQFHYEIRASVGFGGLADVVNRADIRMIESRRGAGFALEAGQMLFRGGQRGGEQLERDVPVKRQIVCLVDLAHAAGADRSDDLESTGDAGSGGQLHSLGDVMDPKTRRFYNGRCAFL